MKIGEVWRRIVTKGEEGRINPYTVEILSIKSEKLYIIPCGDIDLYLTCGLEESSIFKRYAEIGWSIRREYFLTVYEKVY